MEIKRVWFVSHYSMPPEYEMRIKTQMYAHYLGLKGIDCTIFSASTIHNTNINLVPAGIDYIEKKYGDLKFVHIRCSDYSKTDLKRIINMEQFAYKFARIAKEFDPPDIIVADAYCINYKPIYKYCRKQGIPFIVDVRDLWPLSIVEYLNLSEKNPIIKIMYKMEKQMYIDADKIIFSFYGGNDYLRDRGLDAIIPKEKVCYINNGVDIDSFIKNASIYKFVDEDLDNIDSFKVIYVGSIRTANNLGILLDAAKLVNNKKIKFLIWGDGDDRDLLEHRIADEGIDNVIFKGFVEKKYIPFITKKADINLIHNNPSELFKYGISFNKIFDYLAAGRPTLSTFPCKYNPAVLDNTGLFVDKPCAESIASLIDFMSISDNEIFCKNAILASKKYDYKYLSEKLLSIIIGTLKERTI